MSKDTGVPADAAFDERDPRGLIALGRFWHLSRYLAGCACHFTRKVFSVSYGCAVIKETHHLREALPLYAWDTIQVD